jgi:hypothetical protein
MSTDELKELKKQLGEQLKKDSLERVHPRGEHPFYLLRRRT